jgi:alkylation response protein AidB-like acyl-CoA dehydrogenase
MYTAELTKNPYGFSDEQVAFGQLAYRLSKKYERCSFSDQDALDAYWCDLVDNGFAGIYIPEEFGGLGQDMLTMCIVTEQSSAAGWPAQKLVLTQAIFSTILLRNGSREQQEFWLPPIARGDLKFCFGLTEAEAGSNSPRMRTTARRRDDNWVLNGQKTYISGVDDSHAILLAARTPEANDGITLFIVENPFERIPNQRVHLSGMRMYERQFTLYIEDLEVPAEHVVGIPGKGMRALFDGLNPERLLVAAQSVGLGRWGVAKAAAYALQRKVFDDVIGTYQAVQHPLAESYAQLEAAWALTISAARAYDQGGQAGEESNIAKFVATDAAFAAMDRCLQTHGGSGFTDETVILDRYLITRLLKTAPVSREMALNHIAQNALGMPRSY